MKEILNKIRKNALLYVFLLDLFIVITNILLNTINVCFRQWVYNIAIALSGIGIIVGIFQIVRKQSKKVKKIIIVSIIVLIIIAIIFWYIMAMILLVVLVAYNPEYVVEKDGTKYVATVGGFLLDTEVYYYDYINFLVRGTDKRIYENYKGAFNPFSKEHENNIPRISEYYDEFGNILETKPRNENKENKKDEKIQNTITNAIEKNPEPLYEKMITEKYSNNEIVYITNFEENIYIRVVNNGNIMGQKFLASVHKTDDNGKTWKNQTEQYNGAISVNNEAEFVFVDENIGFINNKGLTKMNNEESSLLVTTDGGRTYQNANFEHPSTIEEQFLQVDGVPYGSERRSKRIFNR